ncbi:hypothetical protein FACS1894152_3350 [Bacilli bacterium]|nr:hypothetical protein FACS1894152_3350 [Bacilli bacterium]
MKESHLQSKTRKRKPYRQKRERKDCFGRMLQLDGSFHDWFTGDKIANKKDGEACILNLIDDSTSVNMIRFDRQETSECASLLLWDWICLYGVPYSIYCDKRNMYITEKDKDGRNSNSKKGYFRTMCANLNITITTANSPQARGRIERSNQTHQDRLVKKMRPEGITTLEKANEYIKNEYMDEHNGKFAEQINSVEDIHGELPPDRETGKTVTLDDICYIEEHRKVRSDWTISFDKHEYQLKKQREHGPPCKATVFVRKTIGGRVSIFYGSFPVKYEVIV